MTERKLIVVYDNVPLTELGHPTVWGPIQAPTNFPIAKIAKLVMNGRKVYEANPADPYNRDLYVPLTLGNVYSDNFSGKKVAPAKQEPAKQEEVKKEEPVKEEAPAVEQSVKFEDLLEPSTDEVTATEAEVSEEVSEDAAEEVVEEAPAEENAETTTTSKKSSRKRKNK